MATNPPSTPPIQGTPAGRGARDDQSLALLLASIWAARTGRALPEGPVSELGPEELMNFWADDEFADSPRAAG